MSVDLSSHSSKDGSPSSTPRQGLHHHLSPPPLPYFMPGHHPSHILLPRPNFHPGLLAASQGPMLLPGFSPLDMTLRSPHPQHPAPAMHPPPPPPLAGDLADMRHFINRSLSPPPFSSSDPAANECKMVEYRGKKIASFVINGKTMLCLPQAFDLFLKHLVGGLHTVYTKCKRLDITPLICNVEQVRVLRSLGAIQPGVNRCKLLSDLEFDELYQDCTTQRPGRPPKRATPFLTETDATQHSFHNYLDSNPYHKMVTLPQFMLHQNPQVGSLPLPQIFPSPLNTRYEKLPDYNIAHSPDADKQHRHYGYEEMLQKVQGEMFSVKEQKETLSGEKLDLVQEKDTKEIITDNDGDKKEEMDEKPSCNIGGIRVRDFGSCENSSDKSNDSIGDDVTEDTTVDTDDTDDTSEETNNVHVIEKYNKEDTMKTDSKKSEDQQKRNFDTSMEGLLGNLQEMVKLAAKNALQHSSEQTATADNFYKERELRHSLTNKLSEVQKTRAIYLRRLKKEKKLRLKLQEDLLLVNKKRYYFEDAINNLRK